MLTTAKIRDNIKNEIQIQNVSLYELSEKTGIRESLLDKYINGNDSVRIDVLVRIADALNVNLNKLLGEPYETEEGAYRTCKENLLACSGSKNLTSQELDDLVHMLMD